MGGCEPADTPPGHQLTPEGHSTFRVFAPERQAVAVVLADGSARLLLQGSRPGWWTGTFDHRLPEGTLYWLEVDGHRWPDPASRRQPQGVHGPSQVCAPVPLRRDGWRGVAMADAIVYELHLGCFTPEGTLAAATLRLPQLRELGITVVDLMPIAAFPGERNWGYDGTYPFALQAGYGTLADLAAFLDAAHAQGIAVLLDLVCNHFGPEGFYGGAFAPYTQAAATPWGAAVNFDGAWNHGVREFFLACVRFWLQAVGFDGLRMDAAALVFDTSPRHILREMTDLARAIGRDEGREVLMIAEHLRNDRHVTAASGLNFDSQWNDDLRHALFAHLSGERGRHCANFGGFDDVVAALRDGFVLDGRRFDRHHRWFLGTDAATTAATEHLVHLQNHDQVGNRLLGDRFITTCGRDQALLAITAVLASPFVPMLFMGEEYGETAPFLFFEDFGDPQVIHGCREGRKAEVGVGGQEPPDPHARSSFEASKLQWARRDTPAGREILAYYRALIAMKRSGQLGPRCRAEVQVSGDAQTQVLTVTAPRSRVLLNFSGQVRRAELPEGWQVALRSSPAGAAGELPPYSALVLVPVPASVPG